MGAAAKRLTKVSKRLRTLPERGVEASARRVRAAVLPSLQRDAGSDRTLSGVRNGSPLRVTVTKRSFNAGRVVVGHVMAGPPKSRAQWFWLDEGTKAGNRRVRAGSRRKVSNYRHPGTPAKRTWTSAAAEAVTEARREMEQLYREAMKG